jgi:lipopolysaccharide export LptBFGC system permease protein LptF
MREIFRPAFVALSAACLALAFATLSTTDVWAQAKQQQMAPAAKQSPQSAPAQQDQPQLKQLALTDKQIESALAATKEMDPITAKLPDDAQPDPKVIAQLDGIAKKNGFASYDEYNTVVDNISLVLGGFDPQTKKYVGPEAVIKSQIAQVQADKKMSAKDKKEALADLNEALKSPQPAVENKGNIDLVGKYYDKLAETLGASDQE